MIKVKFALKNIAILALLISSFIACDKDFATVGSDIIGENNFGTTSTKEYPIIAYTNPLEPVQTNNLPINYLGAYNDPMYGLMTASFVSQVGSSIINPDFGENVTLDSVVMTIPYFSTRTEFNSEGETTYELDSVFGEEPINLSIYENDYFLNSIDPNSEFDTPLKYFSNMSSSNAPINPSLLQGTPILLEGELPLTNVLTNFVPSSQEIILKKDGEISARLSPALRVKLDTTFWHNKIIAKSQEEGQTELTNTNNFNNYFRGIYLKTEAINNNGSMALLNFDNAAANITLYYSKNPLTVGADRVQLTYVLRFTGNRVNFINNVPALDVAQGNPVTGDEKLYLKGAQGSIAVVDLFNAGSYEDGFSPEFNEFKSDFVDVDPVTGKFKKAKRLINEANLVFYVDQSTVVGTEPNRIYLYNLKNNTPLVDYFLDLTNTTAPSISKTNHLGVLQREGDVSTGDGVKYKIRITEHINSLLLRDSTNVKLGLAISGNINLENTFPQYDLQTSDNDVAEKVPVSSIISPRGTVLYGNNTTDLTKKLQLEIFYTCINSNEECEDN